jgi:hypothetical protein
VQLRAEEVDPEIPIYWDPKEPVADADEGSHLRDRVRGDVVQLHAVVVAQPAHEAACRCHEATLVVADEADDIAVRRVGLPICCWEDDPGRGCPSTFGASWPPFSSSCSANSVTVERCHGNGSSTWIRWVGAIAVGSGERKRDGRRTLGENERARSALERKQERRG